MNQSESRPLRYGTVWAFILQSSPALGMALILKVSEWIWNKKEQNVVSQNNVMEDWQAAKLNGYVSN